MVCDNEISINGEIYVKQGTFKVSKDVVMVRTYSAGVHFGKLISCKGKEVVLKNARRVWYWEGAATLSQLALDGTSKSDKCKMPCVVPFITLTEAIEIIPMTEKAAKSLYGVKVWKQ